MNSNDLIEAGNQHRATNDPKQALQCYAMAFVQDPDGYKIELIERDA
jgi:hypothetical protein